MAETALHAIARKTDRRTHGPVYRTRAEAREAKRANPGAGRVFRCIGCSHWHVQYVTLIIREASRG